MNNQVGIFFYVNVQFLVHSCDLEHAESYGEFLIYPKSHFEIWERYHAKRYVVDFDFYPRGRMAYNKAEGTFHILYDRCIEKAIQTLASSGYGENIVLGLDEHYQCHRCNLNYVK